jgi:hypothetical protein
MFVVSEADAAAIRAAFQQRGELAAVIELRRRFPGLAAEPARECARAIIGWEPRSERRRSASLRPGEAGSSPR